MSKNENIDNVFILLITLKGRHNQPEASPRERDLGGAHTGICEALPAVKYLGQFFDHLGFSIVGEWYVVGEYIPEKFKAISLDGRLGDIRSRSNEGDLHDITEKVKGILRS